MTKARTNASATPAVGRNMVINGAMNVAQRSASVTGVGATASHYPTLDRWMIEASTAGRATMSQTADGPNGISANCLKLDCTTADTSIASGEYFLLEQKIEGQNLQRIGKGVAGAKQVTISFYVKASAAFDFVIEFLDEDNSRHCCKLFSTTTDWTRVEFVVPADEDDGSSPFDDNNAASARLFFWLHAGATYTSGTLAAAWANTTAANRAAGIDSFFSSTDNNFFVTGFQMEVGPVATEFEQEDIGVTLAKCQRYYQLNISNTGFTNSTTSCRIGISGTVEMRSSPSLSIVDGAGMCEDFGVANRDISGLGGLAKGSNSVGAGKLGGACDATIASSSNGKSHILFAGAIAMIAEL
jgi:hypothetical protein